MLPNLIILGPPKSGTTALYHILSQHEEVFMSTLKEPRFFMFDGVVLDKKDPINNNSITNIKDYESLFSGSDQYKIRGEASPGYFASRVAAQNIKKYIPNAKLVIIVRNPIERAFSHFTFSRMKGFEIEKDLINALELERKGIFSGDYQRNYLQHGEYYSNLITYYQYFEKDQIKIIWYDDFINNQNSTINELLMFLGVSPNFKINRTVRRNVSGVPKLKFINKFLNGGARLKKVLSFFLNDRMKNRIRIYIEERNLKKVRITEEEKAYLQAYYQKDLSEFSKLMNKNLDHWIYG